MGKMGSSVFHSPEVIIIWSMVLHNARFVAHSLMLRRIFIIGCVFLARIAALTGRLMGQEEIGLSPTPMPTLGGRQFWADEFFFHQWRIQRNAIDGHYRLLDEHDFRRASGTYQECRAVLERVKREQHLPHMSGKAVVVLHGLVRSRSSMESLCQYLRDKGGYQVFNVSYPSTRDDISEHARSLRRVINSLDGIDEINFVGHSMGNIVIRHYLGDLVRQEPWKLSANAQAADRRAVARLHRFVMLGPPNQGALLAEVFANNVLFKEIFGESGLQLGRDWPDLEKRLATPTFPFGIIAGGKGNDKGYNPLLQGDNDGTISVETTKLAGADDFIRVPVLHSFLMDNERVQEYVLHFLKRGYFVSKQERHPLEKEL
jgi:pimeloyl-ACP methyl ester carboxylesterase